jgi:methyltransferase (TIGR00027 family)
METRFVVSSCLFFFTAILAIITSTSINGIINSHDVKPDNEKFRGSFDHNTFIKAVYQMCPDQNNDIDAVDFLTGSKKNLVVHPEARDRTRNSIVVATEGNAVYISARSNYFDNVVTKAISQGITQIVIIGAGYDTRAYRLNKNDKVKFFEVDLSPVVHQKVVDVTSLQYKHDHVTYIGADVLKYPLGYTLLYNDIYENDKPAVYILEDFLYHLPQAGVNNLFKILGKVASPGSIIAYDFANECMVDLSCDGIPVDSVLSLSKALKYYDYRPDSTSHADDGVTRISSIRGGNAFSASTIVTSDDPWIISGMNSENHVDWLDNYGFTLTKFLSFHNARKELGLRTWTNKHSDHNHVMSEFNFVVAEVQEKKKETPSAEVK